MALRSLFQTRSFSISYYSDFSRLNCILPFLQQEQDREKERENQFQQFCFERERAIFFVNKPSLY